MEWLHFSALARPELQHGFTLRSPVPHEELEAEYRHALAADGYPATVPVQAHQPHGNGVALVTAPQTDRIPDADALITRERLLPITIRTADCGPLFFFDPRRQAIGLAHSGRRGTEANIAAETIRAMSRHFGTDPASLVVVLAPCIRPPHYEVDIATTIAQQVQDAGVRAYVDCGLDTAADLKRFYSYRMEKGKTGRHYSVLMLRGL